LTPVGTATTDTGPHTEEIRLATALNGGVSLAVWMGGCAVELDCARRAHLGSEAMDLPDDGPAAQQEPSTLGRWRAWWEGRTPPPSHAGIAQPERAVYAALCSAFRRRMALDILTGASAGGINGGLLAAAATTAHRLHPDFIRAQWLDLGDFGALLHPADELEPHALMRGAYFHTSLQMAFARLMGAPATDPLFRGQPGLAPTLPLLDVTTTNIQGEERRFTDSWQRPLIAGEHRARFRFRRPGDYRPDLLATAARASASFPVAFEPWRVSGPAATLAGFGGDRWVLDGGLLDNAPIAAALDLIPAQPASDVEVRRYVCYVNADPPETLTPVSGEPPLKRILGAVVGLPRSAPFADQLAAVERATRRGPVVEEAELQLLAMDLVPLRATAEALLPAYRRQRSLLAIEELAPDPATARAVIDRFGDETPAMPWIPATLAVPAPGSWGWGFRTAERACHLVLDLIRRRLPDSAGADREALLLARRRIFQRLGILQTLRGVVEDNDGVLRGFHAIASEPDPGPGLAVVHDSVSALDPAIRTIVDGLVLDIATVASALGTIDGRSVAAALLGPTRADGERPAPSATATFLQRVLAIEVVRRSFEVEAPVVSAQHLRFVQLTPFAPTPILRPDNPVRDRPDRKLTGVILGHFGGFYRRSWRVNDFMWGRLDAAARIVDLLVDVDPERVKGLAADGAAPWTALADSLLPADADETRHWLVREALEEQARNQDPPGSPPGDDLRADLEEALRIDLTSTRAPGAPQCPLTRRVCARAVQLEILERELPLLVVESAADAGLGAAAKALEIPIDEGPRAMIEALREIDSLPEHLGAGMKSEEITSTFGLRTIVHLGFVALAVLRGAQVPLGRTVGISRVLLLPFAGVAARAPLHRLAIVVGFWAAALCGATRLMSLEGAGVTLRQTLSLPTVLGALALVVIAGVVAVPFFRGRRASDRGRRRRQFAWAAALAASSLGGLVLAIAAGRAVDEVLVAPTAEPPPGWLSTLVLVTVLGIAGGRLGPFRSLVERIVGVPGASRRSALALGGVALVLVGWCLWQLGHQVGDASWWQLATALAAVVVAPLLAWRYVLERWG
jgi:predicted acylesterase/phospholipase RssA